jgi:hypothetical protein
MKHIVVVAIVLCLAVLAVPSIVAQSAGPKVITPNSVAFGRTYSEWSAGWWQWALSIPSANHPLFDKGDCSVGQSGPMWFLGGKFCGNGDPTCGFNHVVRTCSVPAGKALYIAVFNAENSLLELNDPKAQIADIRAANASGMDSATTSFEIDGAQIPSLKDRFRVQSPAFGFTIPDDNLFTAIGEGNFAGGAYFPAMDDGVYVMLSPLPAGSHQIHFTGAIGSFVLDVTYNLTVAK